MLDFLKDANEFILNHKELITVLAIPLITWFASYSINKSAEKRANVASEIAESRAKYEKLVERELAKKIKLADFRQAWINQIRVDFSNLLSLVLREEYDAEQRADINACVARIILSLNPNEKPAVELLERLHHVIREADSEKAEKAHTNANELTELAQIYLKEEWDALKRELDDIEKLEPPQ